jgi:hypothetical protein
MTPANNYTVINKYLTIGVGILGAVLLVVVGFSLITRQTTSLLTIKTFSQDAVVSISQNNKTAAIIGTGDTKVRLQPGTYEVAAVNTSSFVNHQIVIHKQQDASLDLTSTKPAIPSPDDIDFSNITTFYGYGISETQVNDLELLFFKYKPTAQTVTFDNGSIENGSRNPDDDAAPFSLNFSGTIDGKAYNATISYPPSDLNDLDLTLYNPKTGEQLYHQTSIQSVPND